MSKVIARLRRQMQQEAEVKRLVKVLNDNPELRKTLMALEATEPPPQEQRTGDDPV